MTADSRAVYLDCVGGVAGDMLLAGLLAVGGRPERLHELVRALDLPEVAIAVTSVQRGAIGALHVDVGVEKSNQPRRPWPQLRARVQDAAQLPAVVRERSLAVLQRLVDAEARVHATPAEDLHLHELGGADTLIDVVGTVALLHDLGIEHVWASAVPLGSGTVSSAHGRLPVPAPAVVELLRGVPVFGGNVAAEVTTPTGAALLATLVESFGPAPAMRLLDVGYGAGTADRPPSPLCPPNVVRVLLGLSGFGAPGRDAADTDAGEFVAGVPVAGLLIEANIDDMSPELAPWAVERLMEGGASDAWWTMIQMKKGRPAVQLSVLCPLGSEDRIRDILWKATTTLGARVTPVGKWALERRFLEVCVAGLPISVKLGFDHGTLMNIAPEFEHCASAARESGLPLKEVFMRAQEQVRHLLARGLSAEDTPA